MLMLIKHILRLKSDRIDRQMPGLESRLFIDLGLLFESQVNLKRSLSLKLLL